MKTELGRTCPSCGHEFSGAMEFSPVCMLRKALAEVMYQYQHAPLPLDLLEAVPQPVVVLLEVLLEKDPARRFQSPTELFSWMMHGQTRM